MVSNRTDTSEDAADPTRSAAIEVARLVKLYKTTRAVDDVSFRIARSSITGLLGGNGAGKTTTIAMIMGLVLPTSGRIQVLGCPMPEQSANVLGRMNFESPYVDMPMRLTVRQNLTVFGRRTALSAFPISRRPGERRDPYAVHPPSKHRRPTIFASHKYLWIWVSAVRRDDIPPSSLALAAAMAQ